MTRIIAGLVLGFICFCFTTAIAQAPAQAPVPDTAVKAATIVNTQAISEIDIPIQVNLKPIYAWANRFVDTLYTSPNYPQDWVTQGCDIRYQYRFVRGPFRFSTINDVLYISFSGYYGVRGSTRLCTSYGNSPWTPSCSCGFGTEKPRRIDAAFAVRFSLTRDYKLGVTVNPTNPFPVDKCEVCFFGKDITQTVAAQVKGELNASIAAMQKQMQQISLKPYLQTIWDTLQVPYRIPGFGFLSMAPQALRISQARLRADTLLLSVGLSAKPELKQATSPERTSLPDITDFSRRSGFRLFIAQTIPYDSLNGVINSQLAGKEFVAGKGLFKKSIRIDSVRMIGGGKKVFLQVWVSKGANATFFLEGTPVWNPQTQELTVEQMDFHVESRQWLVRTASWLLDGTITARLKEYSRFNLQEKIKAMTGSLVSQMNREFYPGVQSRGYISKLQVNKLEAASGGMLVEGAAEGKLWLDVDAAKLIGQFVQ